MDDINIENTYDFNTVCLKLIIIINPLICLIYEIATKHWLI
jgi:hypothetical protein